ncbi:MAG: OmpA family protein [Burkholderiaceae bacterium]
MRSRSEARTDKGWQGFDRMAGFVSLVLAILLLVVSFLRGGVDESTSGPLSQAGAPVTKEQASSVPAPEPVVPAGSSPAFERIPTHIDSPGTALAGGNRSTEQRKRDASTNASLVVPVLELRANNGKLSIDGIIGSEQVRKQIVRAALERFGMRNITDRVAVSAGIGSFSWAADPKDILVLIGEPEQATSVRVDGSQVTLTGELDDLATKEGRGLAAQQLFGPTANIDNRIRVTAGAAGATLSRSAAPSGLSESTSTPGRIDIAGAGQPVSSSNSAANNASEGGAASGSTQPAQSSPEQLQAPVPPGDEAGEPLEDGKTILQARVPKSVPAAQCARIATGLVVPFRSGRSTLTEDGMAALQAVAPCLERRRYIVGGHTDSRGSAIGNLILSQARAQAVVDYLVERGVPADQLIPKGYGETRPVDTNRTEAGRARNRRIDFRFAS